MGMGIETVELKPTSPFYLFVPTIDSSQYNKFCSLLNLFQTHSVGIVTGRDGLNIHYSTKSLIESMEKLSSLDIEEARACFGLGNDTLEWKVKNAKDDLRKSNLDWGKIQPIQYRPFDIRFTYYTGRSRGLHARPREKLMKYLGRENNLGLISARSNKSQSIDHFFVTRHIMEYKCGESSTNSAIFPLFLDSEDSSNLKSFLLKELDNLGNVSAHDFLHYIYAILYSQTYRDSFSDLLSIDFPRIPITNNSKLFWSLSQFGADLVALHLLEDDYEFSSWVQEELQSPFKTLSCTFVEGNNLRIVGSMSKAKAFEGGNAFTDTGSIIDCSKFTNVPEDVWNFTIGGYQVCHKWLYDRRKIGQREGRTLTDEDILHYRRIVRAIECTLELVEHIDEVIEEHGGWPLEGSGTFELPPDRDSGQMGLGDF